MKKIHNFIFAIVLVLSLSGCEMSDVSDQISNVVQAEDANVLGVKNGTNNSYPGKTYGEAFESFFGSPTWKYFKGTKNGPDDDGDGQPDYVEDDVDVVEFTGYCTYQDVKVKALIQFTLDNEAGTFEATYLSFNDVPQSNLILWALIEKVFNNENETNTDEKKENTNEAVNANTLQNNLDEEIKTNDFIGNMGTYISWDNGYATKLTFYCNDSKTIYYMSFETDIVPNYLDGWEAWHKGDGHTIVIDTYYGNDEHGSIEFYWDTPTTLSVKVNGSTGYTDSNLDYDVDYLLDGRSFSLYNEDASISDSVYFMGIEGYYSNGSDMGYGMVDVTLYEPYAYIELQIDGGEWMYQLYASYVDDYNLVSEWENGTLIYFTWTDTGTVHISRDGSTGESELDWLTEEQTYWNSDYYQAS